MAKNARTGELRTKITITTISHITDIDAYDIESEVNVLGAPVWCKWVNAHGYEVVEGMKLNLKEPATLTMRYSPLVTETCLIYREVDAEPYEIISIDNVEERREWLEVKVQRRIKA